MGGYTKYSHAVFYTFLHKYLSYTDILTSSSSSSHGIVQASLTLLSIVRFQQTFFRHGIAQASLAMLIWLNKNVRFITDVFSPWHSSSKLGSAHLAERKRSSVFAVAKLKRTWLHPPGLIKTFFRISLLNIDLDLLWYTSQIVFPAQSVRY